MIGWLNQGTAHLINQVTIILICVIGKYLKLMWALPGRKKIAKKVKKLESWRAFIVKIFVLMKALMIFFIL